MLGLFSGSHSRLAHTQAGQARAGRVHCESRREQGYDTARAGRWQERAGRWQGYVTARAGRWQARAGLREQGANGRVQARAEPLKARAGLINCLRGVRIPEGLRQPAYVRACVSPPQARSGPAVGTASQILSEHPNPL
jgi:hypothetical protein